MNDKIKRPTGNVRITHMGPDGEVLGIQEKHNIFVDQGREWLASLVSGNTVFGMAHPQIITYMGLGKGGQLQDVPAERTPQTETASVTSISTLVDIATGTINLAALSGVSGTGDIIVPPTTVKFVKTYSKTDITFVGGPDAVPLSECGLFIAATGASGFPSHVDVDIGGAVPTRLVAYSQFRTITKTDDLTLQFEWEVRF